MTTLNWPELKNTSKPRGLIFRQRNWRLAGLYAGGWVCFCPATIAYILKFTNQFLASTTDTKPTSPFHKSSLLYDLHCSAHMFTNEYTPCTP